LAAASAQGDHLPIVPIARVRLTKNHSPPNAKASSSGISIKGWFHRPRPSLGGLPASVRSGRWTSRSISQCDTTTAPPIAPAVQLPRSAFTTIANNSPHPIAPARLCVQGMSYRSMPFITVAPGSIRIFSTPRIRKLKNAMSTSCAATNSAPSRGDLDDVAAAKAGA
jgi:hypothetical protein